MDDGYECLRLENQLCFPLYVCSKEIVRRYRPFLDGLGLTYTQYITMMVLWEHGPTPVKGIGELLRLDSGTLTPLVRKLEEKGYVTRTRDPDDERNLIVSATEDGMALRDRARDVPASLAACVSISSEDAAVLHRILTGLMDSLR